jgi:hypothetical protein
MNWLAIRPIALDHLDWIKYEKVKNLRDDSQSCLLRKVYDRRKCRYFGVCIKF